jgi:hypothetical protein
MADHRSTHYAAPHQVSHHYPSYPSSTHVTYPAAYAVSPSGGAYSTSNQFSDSELQSASTLANAYYTTPRSMHAHIGSPPAQAPMNAHYGSYPPQSMPIPVQRPQYTHSSMSMPYGHSFAPSSDGSPESPMSPLAQFPSDPYGGGQYPASPQRPYACDLCVLSFSRQHDLKRHRDTHSGSSLFSGLRCVMC